jgi:hypothetical protein
MLWRAQEVAQLSCQVESPKKLSIFGGVYSKPRETSGYGLVIWICSLTAAAHLAGFWLAHIGIST